MLEENQEKLKTHMTSLVNDEPEPEKMRTDESKEHDP